MPEISVPQRKVMPTTEIAAQQVKIPPGTFDPQFAAGRGLARAIGQAGVVAGQAAVNTLLAQGEEEFAKANLGYETKFRDFQADLLTDTDYAGYTKKFDDWHDSTSAELMKQINHRGAQTRAKLKFDTLKARSGAEIDALAQRKLVRQIQIELPDKMEGFVTAWLKTVDGSEDQKTVENEIDAYFKMVAETGVIGVDIESLEREYQTVLGTRILENTVQSIATGAGVDVAAGEDAGWDAALKWLDDAKNTAELFKEFGITLADAAQIRNEVKKKTQASQAEGKVELERMRQADGDNFFKRLDALTRAKPEAADDSFNALLDDIGISSLLPTGVNSKSSWADKVNKVVEAINSGKENPLNQSDPSVYRPLRIRADNDPESITVAELNELWGKGKVGGINETQRNTILEMITDKDDPRNAPSAKRGQAIIARLRAVTLAQIKAGAKGFEDLDPRQIELNTLAIQNELDQRLVVKPDATDEEIEGWVRSLTEPAREEITLNWFERVTRVKGRRLPLTVLPFARATEEQALVNKKIKELKDEGIWKKLSTEDKDSARRAFERGGTVQEVINKL